MAFVRAIGWGIERATPGNDASAFEAVGITRAIRMATGDLPEADTVGWALSDHTFEMYRLYEWQAMMTRTRKRWGEPCTMDSPAQRMGHLGAAALPLQMVLAAEGWKRGYAPAPLAIIFAGSDAGERGAILLAEGP
jgi:3-oxoacyl-[acyl-carrier-protein] synthase-1